MSVMISDQVTALLQNENDNQPAAAHNCHTVLIEGTARIVAAYIGNHTVNLDQMPSIIHTIFNSLKNETTPAVSFARSNQEPAVPVNQSVMGEYLICLEDGKKMRMLKRYLRTQFNMTPEDYKAKWNLPANYPMTAPGYSEKRSAFAKQFGLGRQPGVKIKSAA